MLKIYQRYNRPLSAFTLIEVLASIMLLAFIMLGVVSTLRNATSLTRKAKSREATVLSAEIALSRMQREIQEAINETSPNSPSLFKISDGIGGQELTFSYLASDTRTFTQRRTPGMMLGYYHLDKDEHGNTVVLRTEVAPWDVDKLQSTKGEVIATGVLDFKLEAYDFPNDRWIPRWDTSGRENANHFPAAVRITIETVDTELPRAEWKDRSLRLQTEFWLLSALEIR